ncbi:MAG: Rdx family protein [Gemmatimonadota bacterium]|nr:MAG: Rdx family protein [Gemmatimonadota bacterium]
MAAEIEGKYPDAQVNLIGGSGGVFEVTVDGDLVFSKKNIGRHADAGEVLKLIAKRRA